MSGIPYLTLRPWTVLFRPSKHKACPEYQTLALDGVRSEVGWDGLPSRPARARRRDYFAGRGEAVEWKTRAHDLPVDIESRLLAADLHHRLVSDPENLVVFMAEASGEVVSPAWLEINPGTDFAGLWGGSTLPAWRGRGIYKALVSARARVAATRGVKYLQVDASADSEPILRRLGFRAITTTTPFVWTPPVTGDSPGSPV